MKNSKTIIITGTHHTPAIELINLLRQDKAVNWTVYYFGHQYQSETHLAHTIIPKLKVNFVNFNSGKFDRKQIIKSILNIPSIIISFLKAYSQISKIKPNVVVSFGGYVSVPVIIAAYFKHIPSITHEQTLTNSLATRINSYFVAKVALSFNDLVQKTQLPPAKISVTGNLIRKEIFKTNSLKFLGLKQPIIYITGGNQGSKFINELIYIIAPELLNKFSLVHQTGKNNNLELEKNIRSKFPNYLPVEYVESEDIGWIMNKAVLIISRAGANTCQEIDVLDKPSILIPLSFSQQDEQIKNAVWLQKLHPKTTLIVYQNQINKRNIIDSIFQLAKINHTSHLKTYSIHHPLVKLINEISL